MNKTKLKAAEASFLKRYPEGFDHAEMAALAKKHKMEQMISMARNSFAKRAFSDPATVIEDMVTMIGKSSMISMFEKPKFREFAHSLSSAEISRLCSGLKLFLHGDQERGFDDMLQVLQSGKLAKWSLITIVPNYYAPDDEVFVKPTTAKGIIDWFELKNLKYSPKPSFEFYSEYRRNILDMRKRVRSCLAPNNAAFCGFLMMSLET